MPLAAVRPSVRAAKVEIFRNLAVHEEIVKTFHGHVVASAGVSFRVGGRMNPRSTIRCGDARGDIIDRKLQFVLGSLVLFARSFDRAAQNGLDGNSVLRGKHERFREPGFG